MSTRATEEFEFAEYTPEEGRISIRGTDDTGITDILLQAVCIRTGP